MLLLKKLLIVAHRWLGVALCLLFALWFSSGIVMMYWAFPTVGLKERLDRSPELDPSRIKISPAEAVARLDIDPGSAELKLNTFDGRPVYRCRLGQRERMIYADTGEEQVEVSAQMIQRSASAWTGQPAGGATANPVVDVDQWTVQGALRNLRPLWRYVWPNGEEVYVSGVSGEVVQYTTRTIRFWSYLGAIPHWLYFTPLRKHQRQWSQFVVWSSGIGTVVAILGIAVGIWAYSPAKRYRFAGVPTSVPYRGQKRWHAILGLVFGLTAITWVFSGFLSMDPFPTEKADDRVSKLSRALHGQTQGSAFDAKSPAKALGQLGDLKAKELDLTSLAGEAVYLATLERNRTIIIPVHSAPISAFDTNVIVDIVKSVVGTASMADVRVIEEYDAYYLDRHRERPLPVILIRLNDPYSARYYIDPKTARIVGSYSSRSWMSRWLYHGLHSLDFPWLYKYRPLWDIAVISLMLGGTALSITSLILAWRVLLRKLAGLA